MPKKQEDQYTQTSYISPGGNRITVCHPILTPQERENREKLVKAAMRRFYEERLKAGASFPAPLDDKQ